MQVSHALHSCYRPNRQLVGGIIATPLSLQHRSHTPTRTERALHKREKEETGRAKTCKPPQGSGKKGHADKQCGW